MNMCVYIYIYIRKKLSPCGHTIRQRISSRVLDGRRATTRTTKSATRTCTKRCKHQVFGKSSMRISSSWSNRPAILARHAHYRHHRNRHLLATRKLLEKRREAYFMATGWTQRSACPRPKAHISGLQRRPSKTQSLRKLPAGHDLVIGGSSSPIPGGDPPADGHNSWMKLVFRHVTTILTNRAPHTRWCHNACPRRAGFCIHNCMGSIVKQRCQTCV